MCLRFTHHIELSCPYLRLTRLYFQTQAIMGLHTHSLANMVIMVVMVVMQEARLGVVG